VYCGENGGYYAGARTMKPRRIALIGGIALWLGCVLWLLHRPWATAPEVTLVRMPNASGEWFQITNGYDRAILLTDLIVETNSPRGWRAFSHTVPTHPQRLATGDTKDLQIVAPTNAASWRLRVSYGQDVKGSMLFLGKAAFAVSQRKWPGQGFGIISGSNSCIGGEVRR
jgi:hypothetical protein